MNSIIIGGLVASCIVLYVSWRLEVETLALADEQIDLLKLNESLLKKRVVLLEEHGNSETDRSAHGAMGGEVDVWLFEYG